MLIGFSTLLALRTGVEEYQVGADEMGAFIKSAQNVARHYSIETTQKTLDWIAFVGVGGQVFGTRAVAISMKSRERKKQPRGRVEGNVVHVSPTIMPGTDGGDDGGSFAS